MHNKPPQSPDWRTKRDFWQVWRCWVQDRRGDVDEAFEAYTVALGDMHSHEEILDAVCKMTFTAFGKNFVYPWITELAKFLTNLPPPALNVVPLRPE